VSKEHVRLRNRLLFCLCFYITALKISQIVIESREDCTQIWPLPTCLLSDKKATDDCRADAYRPKSVAQINIQEDMYGSNAIP
jgi:hypothetical protein